MLYTSEAGKRQVINLYESVLMQWHQPCKQVSIPTSYGETFVIESGERDAPAVILLHGSGSNSAMWLADAVLLSKTHHVVAVDIIGECGKSAENRPAFVAGTYSAWLLEVIDNLGLQHVSIIGCSLGGWIALDFSLHHPERMAKLILVATAGVTQVKLSTVFWIIITSMMGRWGFVRLNKLVYGNLAIDDNALAFASLVKQHYRPRTDVLPLFSDESLNKIEVPTLFIGGERDCFYDSWKTASKLHENLKNCTYFVLENTGHVVVNQTHILVKFLTDQRMKSPFVGQLRELIEKAQYGGAADIDIIMGTLTQQATFEETRYVDYALSLVENEEGIERIKYFLFHGTLIQRNYASLFLNRLGEWREVRKAFEQGLIDEIQAFAR